MIGKTLWAGQGILIIKINFTPFMRTVIYKGDNTIIQGFYRVLIGFSMELPGKLKGKMGQRNIYYFARKISFTLS